MKELNVLVVEDEDRCYNPIAHDLDRIASGLATLSLTRCRSRFGAEQILHTEQSFDLAILDLGLPERDFESIPDHANGQVLVGAIADRHHSPIPALVILSGNLNRVRMQNLRDLLDERFRHGILANRGLDEENELPRAVTFCLRFKAIDVIEHDRDGRLSATLTPAESCLIKGAVMQHPGAKGITLTRWVRPPAHRPEEEQDDKVFRGRFTLERGESFPAFFKFQEKEKYERSCQSAKLLAELLSGPAVIGGLLNSKRGLLVTNKAGVSNHDPIGLAELMSSAPLAVRDRFPRLAANIGEQLGSLGSSEHRRVKVKDLLSRWHGPSALADAWEKMTPRNRDKLGPSPAEVLLAIRANESPIDIVMRGYSHGDLHIHNVAFDKGGDGGRLDIFDPGDMRASVAGRDEAMLEISLLLHQAYSGETSLVTACGSLLGELDYSETVPVQQEKPTIVHLNTFTFLQAFRPVGLKACNSKVYRVLLMDYLLVQIAGLSDSCSANRIYKIEDAVQLFVQLRRGLEEDRTFIPPPVA